MKKSILFLAILAGIGSGYFYQKSKSSYVEETLKVKSFKKSKVNDTKQSVAKQPTKVIERVREKLKTKMKNSLEDSLADSKKVEVLLKSSKNHTKLFKDTNAVFSKTVKCIVEGRCVVEKQGRFYDKAQDPTVYKLSNMLSIMTELSIEDTRLLEELSSEDLLSALGTGNSGVDTMGSYLLLRLGENTYTDLFTKAKEFKADSAQGFLRLVYDDDKYHGSPSQRGELIEHYILNSDQNTFSSVVKELNTLDLTKEDAIGFVTKTCSRVGSGSNESEKLIRYHIGKIARKFEISHSCKI